jgi:hypothetical protein
MLSALPKKRSDGPATVPVEGGQAEDGEGREIADCDPETGQIGLHRRETDEDRRKKAGGREGLEERLVVHDESGVEVD